MRAWLDNLEAERPLGDATLTLEELIKRFLETKKGHSAKTQINALWMAKHFGYVPEAENGATAKPAKPRSTAWERGLKVRVAEVRASDVSAFLGKVRYMKPGAFNTLTGFIRQLFQVAVADKIVSESPFEAVAKSERRKRDKKEPRQTPSDEQFEKIVAFIRNQRFADHAADSADLAEFLGLAGLGEAEAAQFTWGDLDLSKPRFAVKRFKTSTWFEVPFYPKLRRFLEGLFERRGKPGLSEKVFRVRSVKRALETACRELGYPHFSPRALRRRAIVEQLRSGVHPKVVSKFQGHQDGGKLILTVYSEIISSNDRAFEEAELAKLPS